MAGKLPDVLSGTKYDNIISKEPAVRESDWTGEVSCIHYWSSLAKLSARVASRNDLKGRLKEVKLIIKNSKDLYGELERSAIKIGDSTGPRHLNGWIRAIEEFEAIVKEKNLRS